ncbi:hypothetical protein DFR70_102521 [Nocardia tenerifensis]|uniref:Uncharacterized protein n=1 Tax=Nocardia tenerifensis TaxID=228006 RepID=A0A318K6X2_9NOCA|nr:hypothetical protein [Nocardia tenerifensis]PXX68835.1 hypothetical protein DFR70_102521 [Nocardia tenerifensis]
MRGHELLEIGHIGHTVIETRSSWLRPTLIFFGLIIAFAVLAMVVVINADFDTGPAKITPTHGPCEPFCTAPAAPAAPAAPGR